VVKPYKVTVGIITMNSIGVGKNVIIETGGGGEMYVKIAHFTPCYTIYYLNQ